MLAELDKASRKIDRFASQTNKVLTKWAGNLAGAFSVRAIAQFGAGVIQNLDSLNDMSKKAGESVETLSALGYAAGQSGGDIESLALGLKGLSKTASAAADGNKEAAQAFKNLGIDVEDSNGAIKTTEQLLLDAADQFSRYEDGLQKSAAAQKLFGKSGETLIPFLNEGRAGIEELEAKADELGITLSTKAAQAADDFGDNLATLGAITRGVFARALEEVLPIINDITGGMIEGAKGTERFDKASRILAAGMKVLITTGLVIGEIFDRVGDYIGATAAALTQLAQGNIKDAYRIVIENNKEAASSIAETAGEIGRVWSDAADGIVDDLAEVQVNVKKVFGSELGEEAEAAAKKLEQLGKAMTERLLSPTEKYNEAVKIADQLLAANIITIETWANALGEARGELDRFNKEAAESVLPSSADMTEEYQKYLDSEDYAQELRDNITESMQEGIDEIGKTIDEAAKETTVFAEQAARNTQDIIADALENGFDDGIDGLLDAFGNMLKRMAAQAIAAQIADKVFGTAGGVTGGGGGWLDSAISLVGGFLGSKAPAAGPANTGTVGPRDSGGPGRKGAAYRIGIGAQPETFIAPADGHFFPAGDMGGGGNRIVQNIYTTSPITQRSARQLQLEAARQERITTSRLG